MKTENWPLAVVPLETLMRLFKCNSGEESWCTKGKSQWNRRYRGNSWGSFCCKGGHRNRVVGLGGLSILFNTEDVAACLDANGSDAAGKGNFSNAGKRRKTTARAKPSSGWEGIESREPVGEVDLIGPERFCICVKGESRKHPLLQPLPKTKIPTSLGQIISITTFLVSLHTLLLCCKPFSTLFKRVIFSNYKHNYPKPNGFPLSCVKEHNP